MATTGPGGGGNRPKPQIDMRNIGNGNRARQRAIARGGLGSRRTSLQSRSAQPTPSADDGSQQLVSVGAPEGQTESEASLSPMARSIRDQEISAGRGSAGQQNQGSDSLDQRISRGEFGMKDAKQFASALSGGRERLQDLEDKAHYYKDNAGQLSKKAAKDQLKSYVKTKLKQNTMLWVAGALAGICGVTFAFILISTLAGPLQFIHLGRSVNDFHMSVQEAQTGYMALKLARNIPYAIGGEREKTRMGALGNIYANRVSSLMTSNGYAPKYESGAFKGWLVDPAKLSITDYPGLEGQKPADVQKYFAERGWNASVAGNRVDVTPSGRFLDYYKNFTMLNKIMRDAGVKRLVPIQAHFFKKRLGWTANPMKKWINDKDNKILSKAEKKLKFLKQQRQYTRNGVKLSAPGATAKPGEDGKPGNQDGPNETREMLEERDKALAAQDAGDTSKINEFRNSIQGKFTAGGLAALSILCFMQSLAHDYDILVETNIVEPQERMGMQAMSWGAANERATSEPSPANPNAAVVAEDANAEMADLNYDKKTGTTVMDARSIQYENGQPQSGPDVPDYAKPNPDGNSFTRFFAAVPGLDAVCSTAGQAILFLGAVIVLGPINAAMQFALVLAAGPLISQITDFFLGQLLANEVAGDAAGALRGGYVDQGVFLAANQVGLNSGGVPLEEADSTLLATLNRENNEEQFQQKSLAYRLFNPEDPKSLFAQVLDQQAPNPADNASRIAMGLPNIARDFGSTLARPFLSKVNALGVYNRGRPITAIPFNVLTSNIPTVENPWANANMVSDILDANTASGAVGVNNYITRAKTCHGVTIDKVDATVKIGAAVSAAAAAAVTAVTAPVAQVYATMPPDDAVMPTDKTVRDPDNKCKEDYGVPDANWPRIQQWLKASHTFNAWVCGNNLDTSNPVVKQACIDIGQIPTAAAQCGGTGGGPNITGKYPADITNALGARWKVTLPALSAGSTATKTNGAAPEIEEPAYLTFTDPEYFHLNATNNGAVFAVKPGGATTGGSKNPRSELRETFGGNPTGYWPASTGTHTMEVHGTVNEFSAQSSAIVVGQVHDRADDVSVWRIEGGKMLITWGDHDRYPVPNGDIKLNQPYSFAYVIVNGTYNYYFSPTGEQLLDPTGKPLNESLKVPLPKPLQLGTESYFKAGNYLQSSKNPGDSGQSQVTIFSVSVTHDGKTEAASTGAAGAGTGGAACGGVGSGGPKTSGLPWSSSVWTGAVSAADYTTTARGGVALDGIMEYTDRGSQSGQISSIAAMAGKLPTGFNAVNDDLIVSVSTWLSDNSFTTAAQGSQIGAEMCKIDASPIARIDWEMNLQDGAGGNGAMLTAANYRQWVDRFRAVATAMKTACPGLRVDFNPNHDPDQTAGCGGGAPATWCTRRAATELKDVIDYFGIDIYDNYQSLDSIVNAPGELNESYAFAQSLGKKFSVPEWGVDHSSNGRGDNPAFINLMVDWFNQHASGLGYETYFDEPAGYIQSDLVTQNPQSRQAMVTKLKQYSGGGQAAPAAPAAPAAQTAP